MIKKFNNFLNENSQEMGNHPQLDGLKALWNLPVELLNRILWANDSGGSANEREVTIGYASQYIDYMVSIVDTEDPAEAWSDWCEFNDIEHEIDNNPYLD